jgi:hypothetical protein
MNAVQEMLKTQQERKEGLTRAREIARTIGKKFRGQPDYAEVTEQCFDNWAEIMAALDADCDEDYSRKSQSKSFLTLTGP